MYAVGKKFSVFDATALDSDLPAVGAGIGEIDAGNGIVWVLMSALRGHGGNMGAGVSSFKFSVENAK